MFEIVFLWFIITTQASAWLGCGQASLEFAELTDQSWILTFDEPKLLPLPLQISGWDG